VGEERREKGNKRKKELVIPAALNSGAGQAGIQLFLLTSLSRKNE
jgi:hypothetical protein